VLAPAGLEAERIADIFVWMIAGAVAIWVAVVTLAVVVPRLHIREPGRVGHVLIIGGGVVFPVVVLTLLLTFGLGQLASMRAPTPAGGLTIDIAATQWWWRVIYRMPDGTSFELANEIRLAVGQRVNTRIMSRDVTHSFWIPAIAGKMDAIPGRINQLPLEPTRTGTFRGSCAEFCGTSHALMGLSAVVMDEPAFAQWLIEQARPAAEPADGLARDGLSVFLTRGCVTCHTVRGTSAAGVIGPDLTHVGSRLALAAGVFPNDPESFAQWISQANHVKPDARMPAFDNLSDDELNALAAYLSGLE
jgi:cytochrome c oxidase subunit 2